MRHNQKFTLPATCNRFKNLIAQFGNQWIAVNDAWFMPCFDGQKGVTAMPVGNFEKLSNFRIRDLE